MWSLLGSPWSGVRIEHLEMQTAGQVPVLISDTYNSCLVFCTVCNPETQRFSGYRLIDIIGPVVIYAVMRG